MSRRIPGGRKAPLKLPTPKDPSDVLKYRMDWTGFLARLSDTISTSTWTIPDGLTGGATAIETGNLKTTTWLSGGIKGGSYEVANKIVTAGGRTVERSFILEVEDR